MTLRKDQRLFVSGSAFTLLGDADDVELYFDTERQAIGVAKALEPDPTTFKVTKTYRGGGFYVSCSGFFDLFEIPSDGRRITAWMEAGMLVARTT